MSDTELFVLVPCAKGLEGVSELMRFIPDYVRAHGYDSRSTIRIEPKANGITVIRAVKKYTKLNVTRTPAPTDSKEVRLHGVSPKIECGTG